MRVVIAAALGAVLLGSPGAWTPREPMPAARQEIAVAIYEGRVVVAGGFNELGLSTDTVFAYDPTTDTWSEMAPLPIVTNHAAAAVAAGRLYVFGGVSNRVFAYDPVEGAWDEVAPMRYQHGNTPAVAVVDDRIYVAGGTGFDMLGNEVEVYDPVANRWTDLAPMGVARHHTTGGAIGGRFYVAAGRGTADSATALEVYDPATDEWTPLAPMPTGRSGVASAVVDGRLYVFGGEIPRLFDDVEVYDPASDTWTALDPMPTPRHGIWAGVIGGDVHLPGGATEQGLGATAVHDVFHVAERPAIASAEVRRKTLAVSGSGFAEGAEILLDGVARKTKFESASRLTSKKAGRRIRRGETVTLQVRNPDGAVSEPFEFTR